MTSDRKNIEQHWELVNLNKRQTLVVSGSDYFYFKYFALNIDRFLPTLKINKLKLIQGNLIIRSLLLPCIAI